MTQNEKLDILLSDVQYIKGILESNPKTGQIGVVELTNNNKKRIDKIEVIDKVRVGKIAVGSTIFGFIGGFLLKILLKLI